MTQPPDPPKSERDPHRTGLAITNALLLGGIAVLFFTESPTAAGAAISLALLAWAAGLVLVTRGAARSTLRLWLLALSGIAQLGLQIGLLIFFGIWNEFCCVMPVLPIVGLSLVQAVDAALALSEAGEK